MEQAQGWPVVKPPHLCLFHLSGEVIVSGSFLPLFRDVKNLMAFERSNQTHCLWVVLNYQNQEQVLDLGRKWQSVLLNNLEELDSTENQVLKLAPYQALVLVMD